MADTAIAEPDAPVKLPSWPWFWDPYTFEAGGPDRRIFRAWLHRRNPYPGPGPVMPTFEDAPAWRFNSVPVQQETGIRFRGLTGKDKNRQRRRRQGRPWRSKA